MCNDWGSPHGGTRLFDHGCPRWGNFFNDRLDCRQILYAILDPVDMCSASKSPSTYFTPQLCLPTPILFQYLYCLVFNVRWLENSVSRAKSLHFSATACRLQVSFKPLSKYSKGRRTKMVTKQVSRLFPVETLENYKDYWKYIKLVLLIIIRINLSVSTTNENYKL